MKAPAERTLLVGVQLTGRAKPDAHATATSSVSAAESIAELRVLAESADAEVVDSVLQARPALDRATLIGSGKVNEIEDRVAAEGIQTVIFDNELTPTQLRNLERRLDVKVIDRTQLILDIFARRARTSEGKLQVELAQLNYLLPRLSGRGTQMSRLGGGIGTRGPGETQLETDRRRIAKRISRLRAEIESVRSTRRTQRSQREAVPLSTVSLVGYTNAGKSTLFNRLTGADVLADAKMFATLDPILRQIRLPSQRRILLSDTVGFIRNLPTTLVDAFRATLEEVTAAALLLHVVDISSPDAPERVAHVFKVLTEIGAETSPQLLVLNKSDQLPEADRLQDLSTLTHRLLGEVAAPTGARAVLVSAHTGSGVPELLNKIDEHLVQDPISRRRFRLPLSEGRALHLLHERSAVISQSYGEDACEVVADVPESLLQKLAAFTVPAR